MLSGPGAMPVAAQGSLMTRLAWSGGVAGRWHVLEFMCGCLQRPFDSLPLTWLPECMLNTVTSAPGQRFTSSALSSRHPLPTLGASIPPGS